MMFRFPFVYGVAAVGALVHDALIMLGFAAVFRVEIDAATIAAILTILGYSINDTIVIFDRVRENQNLMRESSLETLLDASVTQTLGRTIITSGATMMAVLALFLLTSGSMKNFGLLMIVGIVEGTYSTIFIASPIVLEWETVMSRRRKRRELVKYGIHDHAKPAPAEEPEVDEETDVDEAVEPPPSTGPVPCCRGHRIRRRPPLRRWHGSRRACRDGARWRTRPGSATSRTGTAAGGGGTTRSMLLLCLSDIHGEGAGMARPPRRDAPAIDAVVLVGDLTHLGGPGEAAPVVEPLLAAGVRVLAVPGNMDRPDVLGWLEARGLSLHGRGVTIGDIGFLGLGGSNPTPFGTPFEVADDDAPAPARGGLAVGRRGALPGARLARAAARHPRSTAAQRTCTSARPWCRAFLESHDVALCLCGHIHEAGGTRGHGRHGALRELGAFKNGRYALVSIEPGGPAPAHHHQLAEPLTPVSAPPPGRTP